MLWWIRASRRGVEGWLLRGVVSACAVFLVGCAGDGPPPAMSSTTTTLGGGGATLALIQQTVFTPTCARLGCHDALTQADGLDLSNGSMSFSELVGQVSNCAGRIYVVAGDPDSSYLLDKLGDGSTAPCGTVMPLALPGLDAADLQLIRDWIAAGAAEAALEIFTSTTTTTTTSSTFDSEIW